jgi:prohibitin 2
MDIFANKKLIGIIAVVAVILIAIFSSLHSVPAGHRGVVVLFGKVEENKVLQEGLHIINPLADIINIDLREQRDELQLTGYTRDIQLAKVGLVLTYSLVGDNVNVLYREIGMDYKNKLILPILENAVKDIVGKWEADALVENRSKAIDDMIKLLQNSLNKKFVRFGSFSLISLNYSDAFERAIEDKQIATQNAIKAKNETVRITEEAKQRLISAKSEAEAMRIKSEALRTNKSLIEYEAVQKWDGKLPQYTGGGAIPFINIKP